MTKKFKMTAATLKKAGKELEEILVPTDDDGNPLKIAVKDQEEMKAKIIEGGNELTPEDEISANLTSVLAELGVIIEDTEKKVDEIVNPKMTWDIVNSMNKKELIKLCEKMDLVTDSGDYDELKDYRTDVAIELEIEVPETVEKELEKDTKEKVKEPETTNKDNESDIEETNNDDESDIEETNNDDEVDLGVLVTGTKKLAHLKEICEIHDDFKKLRKGLKKYKGLSGPRELKPKMLKLLGIEPEEVKVAPKPKVESKLDSKPEKKETPKKNKKVKETETPKTTESKEKKCTKTEFVAALVKEGKYTLNEIVEKATTEMGCSVGSVRTMINHGKNEKHNGKYKPFNGKLIKAIMVFED